METLSEVAAEFLTMSFRYFWGRLTMFCQNVFSKHNKNEWIHSRLTEVEFWTKRFAKKKTVIYSRFKYHQSIFVKSYKLDFNYHFCFVSSEMKYFC